MKYYMIRLQLYPGSWQDKFTVSAENDEAARRKAFKWQHYHGFQRGDVDIRPAWNDAEGVNNLHNEYVL